MEYNLSYVLMVAFYWLFLSGSVFLCGTFACKIFVSGPSGADACIIEGARHRCFGDLAARMVFNLSLFALAVNFAHIFFHAATMTETPFGEMGDVIKPFLLMTKYGKFSLLRTGLLVVIAAVSFVCTISTSRAPYIIGLLACMALLVTLVMSGHKGAEGYLNVPFILNVIHVLTVAVWIGGLFYLNRSLAFFLSDMTGQFGEVCSTLVQRFSALATVAVGLAMGSGLVLAFINVKGLDILSNTAYGRVLVVKVILVGVVFTLGTINKFHFVPLLKIRSQEEWLRLASTRTKFSHVVTLETVFGALALLATALLAHFSPEG